MSSRRECGENPIDDPRSNNMFLPVKEKPFVATRRARDALGELVVLERHCQMLDPITFVPLQVLT